MSNRNPRATARACFTLARQGATEGERAAALNRGMAILERHGLNPDEFDIPGRSRIRGKSADRIIVDDPFAESVWSPLYEQIIREAAETMARGGFSYSAFHEFGGRRSTARERRDAEAARKMDEHVLRPVANMNLDEIIEEIAARKPHIGMFDGRSMDLERERDKRLAAIRDMAERREQQARAEAAAQSMRDQAWKARCEAHEKGRDRFTVHKGRD